MSVDALDKYLDALDKRDGCSWKESMLWTPEQRRFSRGYRREDARNAYFRFPTGACEWWLMISSTGMFAWDAVPSDPAKEIVGMTYRYVHRAVVSAILGHRVVRFLGQA